jgi:septal ring factor EnvC (AmiA/AmiB activator)
MNEQDFQQKLGDLMSEISTLPKGERDKLEKLAAQTKARHTKLKKTVGELQESLDYLRLSIKYLVFDLEATRRENGYLRKMLEEQGAADEIDGDFDDGPDFDTGFDDDDPTPGNPGNPGAPGSF